MTVLRVTWRRPRAGAFSSASPVAISTIALASWSAGRRCPFGPFGIRVIWHEEPTDASPRRRKEDVQTDPLPAAELDDVLSAGVTQRTAPAPEPQPDAAALEVAHQRQIATLHAAEAHANRFRFDMAPSLGESDHG